MGTIGPIEVRALKTGDRVFLCEPGREKPLKRAGYVVRKTHQTRIEIRYRDDDGRKVAIPWSLDTNKPTGDKSSTLWLEHRAQIGTGGSGDEE